MTRAGDSGRPQARGGAGAGGGLAPAAGGPPRRARGAEGRPPLPPDEVAARGRCRRWPWPPSGMTGGSPGWVPPPSCPVEGWDPAPSKRAPNHSGGGEGSATPLKVIFSSGALRHKLSVLGKNLAIKCLNLNSSPVWVARSFGLCASPGLECRSFGPATAKVEAIPP